MFLGGFLCPKYLGFFESRDPQMAKSKKRINFGREERNLPELNLALVQKESWEQFLNEGIAEELTEINPIDDFTGKNWQILLDIQRSRIYQMQMPK